MWQPVLMINGYMLSILGMLMLVPVAADIYYEESTRYSFLKSALLLFFIGFSLFLSNRASIKKITLHQGYLITVVSWFSLVFAGALPFLMEGVTPNFADAVFESTSGITTTGGTVLSGLDSMPKAILLWRSILTAMGGVGIVIFAIALFPYLGIGGMQIFQRENSDFNDKILPKFAYIAKRIFMIYSGLVLLCLLALKWAGMGWFDAVNHAFTTVATGGFSTKDASIEFFHNAKIEMVLSLFMFLGSLPMTFYIVMAQHRDLNSLRVGQVNTYIKILFVYIMTVACWLFFANGYGLIESFRYSIFNVISVTTTTGYSSENFVQWGHFLNTIFIIFMLTGGCTGSTTGSIKIFRWQVVWAFIKRNIIMLTDPNRVIPTKVGNIVIDGKIIASVFVFLSVYILSIVVFTLLLSMTGVDFVTSFSSVISCITSTGPGVVDSIGPAGNYASMPDMAKYLLSLAMILGRLEILTVVVVFTRNFWR